jgi:hypothetical protein
MKIKLHPIPIRDLVKGYINSDEEEVKGYSGNSTFAPSINANLSTRKCSATLSLIPSAKATR